MKRWRMRTTLMVSLLAVSLGLTSTCLLIIRLTVEKEIRQGLDSDLSHSLITFQSITGQRNQMLTREASLLADLPSLKALMSTQDINTIRDGGGEFWKTSGSDFFALTSPSGDLLTYSARGPALNDPQVARGIKACMAASEETCMIPFSSGLYELCLEPLSFGPRSNGSQLGYVVIGYAVDQQVTRQISEVAAADVAFLVDGNLSVTTLPLARVSDLRLQARALDTTLPSPQTVKLGGETYRAAAAVLAGPADNHVQLVVLKSYDRASFFLRRINSWIFTLGVCALFIAFLLAAYLSRTITRPLEALVAGSRALGQGDFEYRVTTDGAVEVRELSLAFDRMRAELQRNQQYLLESDRLATIGRMASSVSHDLRHHLSAIYANAEFMSLARTGAEERLELLVEVHEAVQGMTDLIESLLLFSQTGHSLHVQHESITLLVERIVNNVHQHPECRKVPVLASSLPTVEASVDAAKLGRALYNLILNACQAASSGSGPPTVTITLAEEEERIRIAITDTGNGIPAAIQETLFQPFVSSGKVNGTGLGLTIAQHITQEHGGEIKLEQTSPGTTTFSIILYKKMLVALSRSQAQTLENLRLSQEPSSDELSPSQVYQ